MRTFHRLIALFFITTVTASFADSNSARLPFAPSERSVCKHVGGDAFIRTELFFGLSRQGGPDITEQEFQSFVDDKITPRFPDGLTILGGKGQFKNAAGVIIQEGSKLIILLYPFSKEASANVDAIRSDYKGAFQQESVLRIDEPTCVGF